MTQPQITVGNIEKLLAGAVEETGASGALSGDPKMHLGALIDRKDLQVGVWRCTPGVWEYDFYEEEEVMLMLSGRLRLTDAGGKETELAAGDVFYIPRGWAGRWETLETMEKLYVIVNWHSANDS